MHASGNPARRDCALRVPSVDGFGSGGIAWRVRAPADCFHVYRGARGNPVGHRADAATRQPLIAFGTVNPCAPLTGGRRQAAESRRRQPRTYAPWALEGRARGCDRGLGPARDGLEVTWMGPINSPASARGSLRSRRGSHQRPPQRHHQAAPTGTGRNAGTGCAAASNLVLATMDGARPGGGEPLPEQGPSSPGASRPGQTRPGRPREEGMAAQSAVHEQTDEAW